MTLWVAVGAGIHKNYERPTPVRLLNPFIFHPILTADTPRVSIGAGSVLSTRANALVYTSRCGIAPALLHIRLYFWTESRLSVDDESWLRFHLSDPDQRVEYAQRRAALGMPL